MKSLSDDVKIFRYGIMGLKTFQYFFQGIFLKFRQFLSRFTYTVLQTSTDYPLWLVGLLKKFKNFFPNTPFSSNKIIAAYHTCIIPLV